MPDSVPREPERALEGPKGLEVRVSLKNDEILWDEIAFPTVEKTLKYYLEDLEKDNFIFREEDIKLW